MASRPAGVPNPRPDPGQILLVIHDFQARSPDELSLAKGDRVQLVERDDDFGDGWYLGKHLVNGNTGLFPEVYTKPAPRGQPILPSTYMSTARSQQASIPPSGVSSPSNVPIPSSVFNTMTASSTITLGSEKQTSSDSKKSGSATDTDRTPQASRHSSASHMSDPTIAASTINNLPSSGDVPGTAALTTSPGSFIPRNPALSSISNTQNPGQDSPVMNETLSVIQEHISNMSSPRRIGLGDRRGTNDSGSEYSGHHDHRQSYINGEETDDGEESMHGEAEVNGWTPEQVADYLSSVGVEPKHCEVFREQEISGDVLLGMEQTSVFLKEFDLGSVGRRLKTWQKIKALQDEVKGGTSSGTRRSTQNYGSEVGSEDSSRVRSQSKTGATVLPRISNINERPSSRQTQRFSQQGVKAQSMQTNSPTSPAPAQERSNTMNDSPRRPSAASIRDLHHSRRHSSNDFGTSLLSNKMISGTESPTNNPLSTSHRKGPSFDRNWTMGSQSPVRPASTTGKTGLMSPDEDEDLPGVNITTPWEFDRGYFSGGEIEGRQRNVLRKRGSASHSRSSSYTEEQRTRSATTNARHSRFGSVDSVREPHVSPASQKYYGMSLRNKAPSTASIGPQPPPKDANSLSPTVTKLDGTMTPRSPTDSPRSPDKTQSPELLHSENGTAVPRGLGLRTISDAVTGSEKSRLTLPTDHLSSPIKEDSLQSPSRTESTTSGGPSFELESPSGSKAPSTMTTPGSKTSRKKSKKETSAYTRGLEKKSPKEQMLDCDYSGWMKKKSTNLMTTWKPRLFILKGRRLSYYYSENDEQERGLIDISFHRVLPADNDRITGLHATLTGATTSPTSPSNSHTQTIAAREAAAEPQSSLSKQPGDQMFIFKLMPPRSGLSRAVNFTKPTIHYFAVPNLAQGRLWMAALMKATIDRDDTKPITTTYQQKTISLAKARAMRHRPPALMNLDEKVEDEIDKTPKTDLSGLNIKGIIFDKETNGAESSVSEASKPDTAPMERTSSSRASEEEPVTSSEKSVLSADDALPRTA